MYSVDPMKLMGLALKDINSFTNLWLFFGIGRGKDEVLWLSPREEPVNVKEIVKGKSLIGMKPMDITEIKEDIGPQVVYGSQNAT